MIVYKFHNKQSIISSILFINNKINTNYWCLSRSKILHSGIINNDSLFLYKNYLLTGARIQDQLLNLDSLKQNIRTSKNKKAFIYVPPSNMVNVVYYEDNSISFYFEDTTVPITYSSLLDSNREKYRREWITIIRNTIRLVLADM